MPGRATNEPSNYFALGKQSAVNTEATTFQFLRHLDGTAIEVNEQTESVREGGDGQEFGLRYKTSIDTDGQAVCNVRPEVTARLDAWCLGADTVAVPATLPAAASGTIQEHTAVPTSTLPYLTVEQFFADEIERVTNGKLTAMTVEFEQGRPLKVTYDLVGGGSSYRRDVASVLTATRETGQPFMYPGATVVLDGAGTSKMTRGKLTIRRNVDTDIRTTSLAREDTIEQNFEVEVEGTLQYIDKTLYDKVHYGSGSQIPIDLATGSLKLTSSFGSGTNMRLKEYGANQFHYTGARVNKLDPDGKTMYLDFTGMGYKGATHQVYSKTWTASAGAF